MLVKATLGLTPNKDFRLDNDLKALVKIIDMKILSGPHTVWCDTPGNVGYSSAIIIETSSITWHSWNHTNELHRHIFLQGLFDRISFKLVITLQPNKHTI